LKNSVIIIVAILVLATAFFVFTDTPVFVKGYSRIRNTIGEATGPTLKLLSKPADLCRHIFDSYINLVYTKKENVQLKKDLDLLQIENQKIPELERENKRLKTILDLVEQNPNTLIVARVIGEDVRNWFKCVIIDKGKNFGVKEKMPVITPKGIVGQTVEVNRWHAKVMIINDTNSSVDVSVDRKSTRGILEGTGHSTLKLKYIMKNEEIEIGDKLVTSGKDGIYPKGLPTGIVITVNRNKPGIFADVDVMPFNNFKTLQEVLVVKR
jgi:rod shape-determining protein MreC